MKIHIIISLCSSILQPIVEACLNGWLVQPKPKKSALINGCEHINHKALKEMATMQQHRVFVFMNMQLIHNISSLGEMLGNNLPTIRRAKLQCRVPSIFAIGKKEDIVQGDISRMQVVYNL